MRGEIISIGDELTSGQRLDTNTQWLAKRLTEIGVDVMFHTTVGDDLDANVQAFSNAIDRAEVVVTTGGLGPTADDLTREALSQATGRQLVEHAESLAHIQQLFATRGRPMPERNKLQALLPDGASPIPNQHGTAPGVQLREPREGRAPSVIFCLPGVPAEMMPMWDQTVQPAVLALHDRPRVIRHRSLKCFGVGESQLEAMMPDLIARTREPRVGITVSRATITLRITTSGATAEECFERMKPTEEEVRETLGVLVFGEEEDELQHVVTRLLAQNRQTLAVVDASASGLLVDWLAEADPRGDVMRQGRVDTWSDGDEEHAADLARRLREERETDFALLLAPADKTHAIESVLVALAYDGGERTKVFPNLGHPDIAQDRAAKLALNFLRLHMLKKI